MGVCRICQGDQLFGGAGHAAKRLATRVVAKRLLGGLGARFPDKYFFNGAIWCWFFFGAYFHKFFTLKKF